jgi:pilus assembly protein CpaE
MRASRSSAALKPERAGILAVVQEQQTADRLQGICRDMQLDDELVIADTLDAALRRIRSGYAPRVLRLDLADAAAPIADVSSARTVGGAELKIVVLGALNDVALFRDLLAAGANDYLVKPPNRETLSAALEKRSHAPGTGSLCLPGAAAASARRRPPSPAPG